MGHIARFCKGAICLLAAGSALGQIVQDKPAPLIETGVSLLEQLPGKFAWLDDDTLAITTYGDEKVQFQWTVRKIVAFDARRRSVHTLVEKGGLYCVNPSERVVSLYLGDLQSSYVGNSKSPPAVPRFHRWSSATGKLEDAEEEYKARWSRFGCLQPSAEDLNGLDWMLGRAAYRYLRPGDGRLEWESIHVEAPQQVIWKTPKKSLPLQVRHNEIAAHVSYIPFADSYMLASADFAAGLLKPRDNPLLMMRRNGEVTRTLVPDALKQLLASKQQYAQASMRPVAGGYLLFVPGRLADGAGFYLARGQHIDRVWCSDNATAAINFGKCEVKEAIEISPNGCRVAFGARSSARPSVISSNGTVQILELCDGIFAPSFWTRAWEALRRW